jgi:hypothetical protein
MDNTKKIGALWVHEDKKGKKYLSGKCQDVDIVVFKNGYKEEGTNKPDWIIYVSEKKDKPEESDPFGD